MYATGRLTIGGSFVSLRNADGTRGSILVGQNGIDATGGSSFRIEAPVPFPALISGVGSVSGFGIQIRGGANIDGNIWSSGLIDINASNITGIIIGLDDKIKLTVQNLTDHQAPFDYYETMSGFTYPQGLSGNGVFPGTWRELE